MEDAPWGTDQGTGTATDSAHLSPFCPGGTIPVQGLLLLRASYFIDIGECASNSDLIIFHGHAPVCPSRGGWVKGDGGQRVEVQTGRAARTSRSKASSTRRSGRACHSTLRGGKQTGRCPGVASAPKGKSEPPKWKCRAETVLLPLQTRKG